MEYLEEGVGLRTDSLTMDGREVGRRDDGRPIGTIAWSSDDLASIGGTWKLCALEAPRQQAGTWGVQGPCEVDADDPECVMSPNFPGNYAAGDLRCTMWIYGGSARHLEITRMEMETGFPPLFMGGAPVFPDSEGALIDPGLSWSSADTGTSSIWRVCARPAVDIDDGNLTDSR